MLHQSCRIFVSCMIVCCNWQVSPAVILDLVIVVATAVVQWKDQDMARGQPDHTEVRTVVKAELFITSRI